MQGKPKKRNREAFNNRIKQSHMNEVYKEHKNTESKMYIVWK